MPCLTMGVVNARGEKVLVAEGRDEVTMSYRSPFEEGDSVFFECDEPGTLLMVRACDYAEPVVALYAGGTYTFPIPFGEAVRPYGNIAFLGSRHWGYARTLSARERQNYRNLAENPFDFPGNKVLYPHAETNVTTTEQYFARNAIDGVFETSRHGSWPHASWGINRQDDAWLRLEFGRTVSFDRVVLYLRAEFPHDSWWRNATLVTSRDDSWTLNLVKSGRAQAFDLGWHEAEWVELRNLVKGEAESPWPALTQIEIWGTESRSV